MRTLVLGYAKDFLTMFVKRKKNRSGTTSVVVAEKSRGNYKELVTIGIAKDSNKGSKNFISGLKLIAYVSTGQLANVSDIILQADDKTGP